jgi:hypothetical protein
MTGEEIKQEVRKKMETMLYQWREHTVQFIQGRRMDSPDITANLVNQILSIPNLAIINPKAELPENPYKSDARTTPRETQERIENHNSIYSVAQQDMISQGWVKRIGGK